MGNKARVWLYKEGNECSTITGGWSGKNYMAYAGSNYATKNSNNLEFGDNGTGYGYGGFRTNNTISLSQFSTMYIDWQQYSFSLNIFSGTGKSGGADSLFFYTSSSTIDDAYSYGNSKFANINNTSGTNNTTRRTDSSSMDAVNNSTKYYLGMAGMAGYINPDTVKTRTYNIYMDSRKDIITVSNQNNTQLTLILDNLSNMITFTKIEILANNKVIKTYNENLSTIVYNFDSSIMEWGNSTISIKATYTQGDGISNVVDTTSPVKYQKNLVTSHYFRIIEQNENLVTISSNDIEDYPLYINRIDILTNDRILQIYNENLSEITYEFNKDLMDWGNNEISIHVTYTEKSVVKLYKVILDIEYKKEVEIEELDPIVDLPSTSTLKDIMQRFSVIESTNKAISNNLKNLLMSKGFEVGDAPRLSSMVKLVNELSNNNSAEITEYINRITELESENEANKRTLISKLEKFNIKLVGDENINALINLIDVNNLNLINIKQIACGNSFVVILKKDGSLWGCGYNQDGQLGLGDNNSRTTMTQITTNINNDVKYVVCGANATFIIKNDCSLWVSGWNDHGQLGLGNNVKRNTFAKVTTNINNDVEQIVNCYCSTFILKNDGSLWACGLNNYGQLGLGDTTNRSTFTKVTTNVNNDVKQISCMGALYQASTGVLFYGSAAILKIDGSIWTAGYNAQGQLGLGDTTNRNTFTKVTTNINNDVKQILCGGYSMYVLKNDDSIWACGYNAYGQLGLGDTTNRNTFTQVTTNVNNDVKQIVSGGGHVFILKNDGSVWSCGNNSYGQLGLNNTTNKTTFTQVATNIELVECGGHMSSAINGFTFIIKTDGSLWACGRNNEGQLGLGDTTDRTTFIKIPRGF